MDINTRQFSGTERSVANGRYYNLEISEENRAGFSAGEMESSFEDSFEIFEEEEGLKKLPQPFNVFKTISQGDFDKWDTDFLIEFIIRTHHDFAKKNAVIVYCLAQKAFYRHCENHPELLTLTEVIFLFLHDLLNQIRKEEFFFAYIRQISKAKRHLQTPGNADLKVVKDTIKLLRNDQGKSLNYLKVIRQITDNYRIPSDACHSHKSLFEKLKELEEDLILHFRLEKNILFPKAAALAEKHKAR